MPKKIKITERLHAVNPDSNVMCPRCQEEMHKNSTKDTCLTYIANMLTVDG